MAMRAPLATPELKVLGFTALLLLLLVLGTAAVAFLRS